MWLEHPIMPSIGILHFLTRVAAVIRGVFSWENEIMVNLIKSWKLIENKIFLSTVYSQMDVTD
jgi:hypothetical protein